MTQFSDRESTNASPQTPNGDTPETVATTSDARDERPAPYKPKHAPLWENLITMAGMLDAVPHHRSFWTVDTQLYFDATTKYRLINGDILVMNDERFYQILGYEPGRHSHFDPRTKGYTLSSGLVPSRTVAQARVGWAAPSVQ